MGANASVPTIDDVLAWPVTVDVPTAGRCFGLGRDVSYDLVLAGNFPIAVLKFGKQLRVTRSAILAALGIPETAITAPGNTLTKGSSAQVHGAASDTRSEAHAKRIAA